MAMGMAGEDRAGGQGHIRLRS